MIKVGDLITSYRKGYYRVLEVAGNSQVTSVQVMTSSFKPSAAVKDVCHMNWCKLVDEDELIKELKASIKFIQTL